MLTRLARLFESSRLMQLFIITACIQGGVIVSQFLITPWVEPSVVGMVRSVETVISLVVLAGSFGMQSIAIRDTAETSGLSDQSDVLRQVFLLVGVASAVVIAGVYLAHAFLLTSAVGSYVLTTCGLVLLTNLLRVTTGFAQGAKIVREIYIVLMLVTAIGVVSSVLLTRSYGINGWIVGRYFVEFSCLAVVWWKLRAYVLPALDFRRVNRPQVIATAMSGLAINASLFVRLLVDSLPILLLTAFHVRADEVGFFGVAILSLVLGLLPLAIIAQRAIPDFVEVLYDKNILCERYKKLSKLMLKVSSAAALALIVTSLAWLQFYSGSYESTALYVMILALILPFKAIALSCGTMLMALRVFGVSLKVNVAEGVLVLLVLCLGIPGWGGWAAVVAYFSGTILSVALLLIAVKVRLADR